MQEFSLGITFFYHNFVRIHQALRMTPSMKAAVDNRRWDIGDMVDLILELEYNTHPKKNSGIEH